MMSENKPRFIPKSSTNHKSATKDENEPQYYGTG